MAYRKVWEFKCHGRGAEQTVKKKSLYPDEILNPMADAEQILWDGAVFFVFFSIHS